MSSFWYFCRVLLDSLPDSHKVKSSISRLPPIEGLSKRLAEPYVKCYGSLDIEINTATPCRSAFPPTPPPLLPGLLLFWQPLVICYVWGICLDACGFPLQRFLHWPTKLGP